MLRIFWGPDTFSRAEALALLKRGLDADGMLSVNTAVLDGAHLDLDVLIATCDTVPFLAQHRLVVAESLLGQAQARPARRPTARRARAAAEARPSTLTRLADYVPRMPPTTTLLLLEGDLRGDNAALTALRAIGEAVQFPRKTEAELRLWLGARARLLGAELEPPAAGLLIESTRGDLWSMASELEKLSLYASGRAISEGDVRAMVPAARDANVFALVDAIVDGRTRSALGQLELLLEQGAAGPYLITMMARQYRQLIVAEDLLRSREPPEAIARAVELRLDTAGMRRLLQQARRADPSLLQQQLEAIAAADAAIKRGEMDEHVGLYTLVAELTGRAGTRVSPAQAPG